MGEEQRGRLPGGRSALPLGLGAIPLRPKSAELKPSANWPDFGGRHFNNHLLCHGHRRSRRSRKEGLIPDPK